MAGGLRSAEEQLYGVWNTLNLRPLSMAIQLLRQGCLVIVMG